MKDFDSHLLRVRALLLRFLQDGPPFEGNKV